MRNEIFELKLTPNFFYPDSLWFRLKQVEFKPSRWVPFLKRYEVVCSILHGRISFVKSDFESSLSTQTCCKSSCLVEWLEPKGKLEEPESGCLLRFVLEAQEQILYEMILVNAWVYVLLLTQKEKRFFGNLTSYTNGSEVILKEERLKNKKSFSQTLKFDRSGISSFTSLLGSCNEEK